LRYKLKIEPLSVKRDRPILFKSGAIKASKYNLQIINMNISEVDCRLRSHSNIFLLTITIFKFLVQQLINMNSINSTKAMNTGQRLQQIFIIMND